MDETCRKYDSVHEMMESMPCELEWTVYWGSGHHFTVCCSRNNDELQRLLTNSSITYSRRGTGLSRMDALSRYLKLVSIENCLLQFWAPVTIWGKRYLTTSDQPFALAELVKGLCSYRRRCLDILIPIHDVTTEEEGHLGPPGRVFLNGLPEVCFDVRYYTSKEYPQRDFALPCGVCCYLAFPLHKSYDCKFDCVVEIVADGFQPGLYKLAKLVLRYPRGGAGIEPMLQAVCDTHRLPLAQTWVSMPYQDEVRYERKGSYVTDDELRDFTEACRICRVKKGRGVVGKAFSSQEACFCENISQLSITEYSLVPSARKAGLTGCFAILLRCLTSSSRDGNFYIVEFFLPKNETGSSGGDPRTLIKMLLATMKQHLKSLKVASGQELGEKLFVEVIKTSPTAELDSFEICDDSGIDLTPTTMELQNGEEMVQLYYTRDAEDVIVVESGAVPGVTPGAASSYPPVHAGFSMAMQFANSSYDNHGFAGKMHQEGTEAFPAATPVMDRFAFKHKDGMALFPEGAANVLPDASYLHQHGGQVVHFVNATSHSENVNNAEQDIASMEQCNTNSIEEIVQLDDASSKAKNMNINGSEQRVVSMEKRETNSKILKNQRAKQRIHREYGITRSGLQQHSREKQKDAAAHFGVSRSTFKRICREHQIFRWPPREVKHDDDPCNIAQEFVQPTEETREDSCLEESPLPVKADEQNLNSKPDSVRNAMTGQNDSSIAVKVAYRDYMIRFDLAVSSGKMELEEEIAKRLHLSIGSFSVKYLDEDEDWISLTSDADLKTCLRIMNSFGKNKVKMVVNLPQDN